MLGCQRQVGLKTSTAAAAAAGAAAAAVRSAVTLRKDGQKAICVLHKSPLGHEVLSVSSRSPDSGLHRHATVLRATSEAASVTEAVADASDALSEMSAEEPTSFRDLGIDPILIAGLEPSGIDVPSPIQEAAIPVLLSGQNAAIQSYTGSGKTLAYLLPSLTVALRRAEAAYKRRQAALAHKRGRQSLPEEDLWTVQVLVVAPSQELAMQITRVAQGLFPEDSRSAVQQAIGGANLRRQAEAITEHQPIMVVGTPGRIVDLVGMGVLRLHRCPLLILDEADQLLGDVYAQNINVIEQHCGKRLSIKSSSAQRQEGPGDTLPEHQPQQEQQQQQLDEDLQPSSRQTVLVSATLWSGGLARFKPWCSDPHFVTMGSSPTWSEEFVGQTANSSAEGSSKTWGWGAKGWEGPASVAQAGPKTQGTAGGPEGQGLVPTLPPQLEHIYIVVNPDRKSDVLRRAVHALNINMGLGFMNWQQRLKDMAAKVTAKKIEAEALHGELSSSERVAIFDAARKGAYQLLLVSDLAARGLDLPQVDAVFNLELPSSAAHYAHRAGRTGRMGAPGLVITFAAPGERFVVERLSKKLGVPILESHLAGGELVAGPPPQKPRKKPRVEDSSQNPLKDADADKSQPAKQRAAPGKGSNSRQVPAKVAPAAATGSKPFISDVTFDAEAAAFDPTTVSDNPSDESGIFLLDEADDLDVEGDEPLDAYRTRLQKELRAELAEIQEERKQQRRTATVLTSRKARGSRSPVPKGSPQEAAALAIAAIEADEATKKARARLPPALLGVKQKDGGSSDGSEGGKGSSKTGRQLRGTARRR